VTLSDEELRQSLTTRAALAGAAANRDLGRVARVIATSPSTVSRARAGGRFVPRLLIAAGTVVAGIALLAVLAIRPSSGPGVVASVSPTIAATPQQTLSPASASPLTTLQITGCESVGLSIERCRAIVGRARDLADPPLRPVDVTAAMLTEPVRGDVLLGSDPIATVRFDLASGGSTVVVVSCGLPGPSDRVCNGDPRIYIAGGVDRDVPCAGEAPENPCATLPPTARPASVAAAQPLRVPVLDIALDHLGRYEIAVGAAGLPDGVLTERSARLAVEAPTTFWIDDGVRIDIRPDDPRRPPIGSIYRDPFRGVEPVHVFVVFDVVEFEPGAVLQVRDLVVR